MESCLTELGKICMEKLVDRALAELRHVFCFTCIANEFKEEKLRLEPEIKTLEQLVKVAAGRGNDIKANADSWKKKADKLIQEDIETKQTCFFGLCPDCIWRYKKGKELANYTQEIKQLIAEKHDNIELPRRLPDVERYSSKDYISLQSRESKYEELLDALKDENNYMIGLQGMGGIGKTTLAKEVGKALQLSGQFSQVIVTTVSFTPDTKKIQDDIAGSLELKWEDCNDSDRPKKLWSRLTNGEKVLLIMDDVWDQDPPLDFDLIGIPTQGNHKGCRVLITTRSKRILNKMDCKKMIELGLLSEEDAWTMFKTYAGIENSSSKNVITKGRKISKECKQLPVAIALVASSLRGQQDRKHEWDATLKSLKKPVPMDGVDDEMVGVYKCLKFSYDCMKNEQAKELFLLSSVFPEDEEISSELLTRLGIGMGLFGEDYGSYDDARNQVIVAKNKLIDSSLLMGVDEKQVKMHDLVREVAQWIANKEIQCVNLSNKDQKSSLEREKNIKYLFCKGKDMDLFSCKYDGSKLKILIVEVEEDEDLKCMEVPNSFFENIGKLQVLLFFGHDKRPLSLPDSIHSLTNIRSIYFRKVDLGDISVLGNLQTLETLDLVYCIINELPHEIAKLGKLKLLKLEYCKIRRNDPFEVIERCSTLEELYFIRSFNDFCRKITLPKLRRYVIRKGGSRIYDSLSKYVCFEADDDKCFLSKETFKYCMQTLEGLQLDSIKEGWRNLMPEIVPVDQGMKDLVELHLRRISQLQCLIDTTGSQVPIVLSKLKKLYLDGMENLEELFNGSISFDSLKNLKRLDIKECKMFQRLFNCELNLCNLKSVTLRKCPMLVNIFPRLTSRSLVLLEILIILDCEGLENIVIDDGDNNDKIHGPMFPKLRALYVVGCHRLESIFPFLSLQDFPVLEDIKIRSCDKLKYIFGQYQHVELSSLKEIDLGELPNFMGIFPEYSHSMSSLVNESSSTSRDGSKEQTQVHSIKCNILSWSCICCDGNNYRNKSGSMSTTKVSSSHSLQILKRAQCLPVQSHIMCYIKEMTLSGFSKIKSVFMLSMTSRMLVETLRIENCDELKYIIIDIGDDDSGGNNRDNAFPNLKTLVVVNCKELEFIFGHNTDVHLPTLECLILWDLQSLVAMCPKQYSTTFPPLKTLRIKRCPLLAIKSIGEFIINHSDDSTITKELSGSMDHFIALESLVLHHSKAENILFLNEIKGQPINLGLMNIDLCDLPYMMCLFVAPQNSFSLQNLTNIKIVGCEILENIVINDGDNDDKSHGPMFPKLRILCVVGCHRLESIFPFLSFQDFPVLNYIQIRSCGKLKYIFGQYHHVELSSSVRIQLDELPNFMGIFPEYSHSMLNSVNEDPVQKNSSASVSSSHPLQILKRAQCLPGQSHIMCNIKEMTLSGLSKIKSVFMLSNTSRMLVETLIFENCDELKYIIVDNGDDDIGGNNWDNAFPNLTTLKVKNCKELEYIFGHNTDVHLPTLECLTLLDLQSLVAMCPKQYSTTFPRLKDLTVISCPLLAIKSIGELIINHSDSKYLDSTITKELSGSMDHFIALESLVVRDLNDMIGLFVGLKNSFSLQNLTEIKIVGCEILEIVFSNSISTCLSQLTCLIIEECKELKHIIEDDTSNSLSSRTFFPKLKELVVIKCHKLKCVFPVSICKELPKLEGLMISEADELEEIFKSKGDQKVEIPNLNVVAFVNLPSLFHTQEILFQAAKNRFVQNCQKLSLTSDSTPDVEDDIYSVFKGFEKIQLLLSLFEQLEDENKGNDIGSENSSAKSTKDIVVGSGIEVEESSSQLQMKQTLEAGSEFVENASDLEIPSVEILPTNTKEQDVDVKDSLEAAKLNDDQDFQTREHFESPFQQLEDETKGDDSGNENRSAETTKDIAVGVEIEVEATLGHKLTFSQIKMKPTPEAGHEFVENTCNLEIPSVAILPINSKELEKEQQTGHQGPLGEIDNIVELSQGDEEGTALTNAKTITTSTHSELVTSSQEQDVDVRDSLETTTINDDRVSLNEDVVMKESSIIEEHLSKPSTSNSVPLLLAFQAPSMHFEGDSSQKVEDLGSPYLVMRGLEELLSVENLDYKNLPLLADFLVKHPSNLLWDTSLSNKYKGYAYNCLADLLKFLQTHSVLDVLGSSHSEFVKLLREVRECPFDKDWLDGVEKRALFPDLQFSQDALQKVLDSKKQVSKDVEVVRFKIDIILTQNVEELKQQLSSYEAYLESIIQQEKKIVESKAALSAPLGY